MSDVILADDKLVLPLPAKLSQAAARDLWRSLMDAKGSDLILDASGVQHIGAQCMQILVAGRQAWREAGSTFTIADPSETFTEGVEILGLQTHLFGEA